MFALAVCAFTATSQVAADPVVAVQTKYPVRRVAITTNLGTTIHYQIPLDAPPELWRAVKVVELAERDVLITEGLHQLKLEMVQNERRLEALRTNFLAAGLQPAPGNGFGNGGWGSHGGRYYMNQPPLLPESALRTFLSANLALEATTERALLALDNLFAAQQQLHRVWISLAFPERKVPGDPTKINAPAGSANKALISTPLVFKENIAKLSFDEACKLANELAVEDEAAQKRLKDAVAKRDVISKRFAKTDTPGRVRILTELETANRAHLVILSESREIRRRWEAASDRVIELTPPLEKKPGS